MKKKKCCVKVKGSVPEYDWNKCDTESKLPNRIYEKAMEQERRKLHPRPIDPKKVFDFGRKK